ncbi:hypothetical protein F4801DRAFT_445517 [Xylaria longipes]|nr:hypothetical protein F4801DRAFT_445517 [Xylaria longipes]
MDHYCEVAFTCSKTAVAASYYLNMHVSRLLVSLLPVAAAIIPVESSNNTSPSLSQQEPEAESVFVNGSKHSAATIARHNDEATLLPTNKSDTDIVAAASITHSSLRRDSTQHQSSDPKRKKKKRPKNKNNSTNSTEENDDDDSGVGRGITLPISLAVSLVLLVGALQI